MNNPRIPAAVLAFGAILLLASASGWSTRIGSAQVDATTFFVLGLVFTVHGVLVGAMTLIPPRKNATQRGFEVKQNSGTPSGAEEKDIDHG